MNDLIFNLAILQVGTPVLLILAHTLVPSTSRLALLLRAAALLTALQFAALAGLWLFPPWWTPYALMVLLALGTVFRWRRGTAKGRGWWRITEPVAALIVGVGAGFSLLPVYEGRNAPTLAIDLAMPLGPGRYLVTSGGSTPVINAHMQLLSVARAAPYRGQGYALDIIAVDWMGRRTKGISPTDPTGYAIYGTPVLAPCDGTVALVTTGVADMPVPQMDRANMTGNSVMLACGDYRVLLAHLAPGSITVAQGDSVTTGSQLGRVGNTGNTGEPHLHIHVQQGMPADAPIGGEPVWFTIDGAFYVRNSRFVVGR
jgi:hypothetical protein